MTDEKIIALFFERDETAISNCDIKYGAKLRGLGERITSDAYLAEECVDDAYMKTWNAIPPKNPKNYLFAFLAKILRNVSIDKIRERSRDKRSSAVTLLSTELSEAVPDPESADSKMLKTELSELITSFVSKLGEDQRRIFVMRYFYMEDLKTISKRLLITEGKVKTVLHRTRDKLRLYLQTYGYHA